MLGHKHEKRRSSIQKLSHLFLWSLKDVKTPGEFRRQKTTAPSSRGAPHLENVGLGCRTPAIFTFTAPKLPCPNVTLARTDISGTKKQHLYATVSLEEGTLGTGCSLWVKSCSFPRPSLWDTNKEAVNLVQNAQLRLLYSEPPATTCLIEKERAGKGQAWRTFQTKAVFGWFIFYLNPLRKLTLQGNC